jgi:uncharacterized protein (TIGR03067 family)
MSRYIPVWIFTLSLVPSVNAAETPMTGDLARFQGRWIAKAGAERKLNVTLDIAGTRIKVKIDTPQGLTIRARGELVLDETKSPRALDWVKFTGPDGAKLPEVLAIYEFRGDSIQICNGGPNNPRPSAFTAGDGPFADVLSFERPTTTVGKIVDATAGNAAIATTTKTRNTSK